MSIMGDIIEEIPPPVLPLIRIALAVTLFGAIVALAPIGLAAAAVLRCTSKS